MDTYEIVCFFADPRKERFTVESGLTLEEAKERCADPETSSKTCTTPEGEERTRLHGDWFYGFTKE